MVRKDTYIKKDQALKHFRNALSHGRIGWTKNNELLIKDRNDHKNEEYTAAYSMESLGELAQSLNKAVAKYITSVIQQRPQED